jgi:hypothetical protein
MKVGVKIPGESDCCFAGGGGKIPYPLALLGIFPLTAKYVVAMRHGIGLNKIPGTIHIYPTLVLRPRVKRFHAWRRAGYGESTSRKKRLANEMMQ